MRNTKKSHILLSIRRVTMSTKLEKKIEEIENIVSMLENEGTDIDEAITMYEKSISLIKECEKIIGEYEEKIKNVLNEENEKNE